MRLPTLQLPTFRCEEEKRDDIAELSGAFRSATSHLPANLKTTLLKEECVGKYESQQANAATAINRAAPSSSPPVSSDEVLFGLPAFTDPTAIPVNEQGQLGNRNILWTPVTSAGRSLHLPLGSFCSVSLVSADHAEAIISKRPLLQYGIAKLAERIPIKWNSGKDSVFTMLVVPLLTWPIIFGKNHLHATKALVDHDQPSVTFRHPSMQFSVSCSLDNQLKRLHPQYITFFTSGI